MSKIEDSFAALVQGGHITKDMLRGCSDEEIAALEVHFNCRLPSSYRDFLSIAGKGAGKLFQGTDIFYPRILQLQREARDLLLELNLPNLLPDEAKVFCMHQGYELNYFLPNSEDPAIFQFFEGQQAVTQPWNSFSDFIETSIESHLKHWPELS